MLTSVAQTERPVRETFDEASAALGFDLWTLVSAGPEEALNRTENTQPAMLAADVAMWRVWRARGGSLPRVMVGHSLGEYAALVAAEAMSFTDAVTLVRDRGRFMQEAVPTGSGAMAAVLGLDDAVVARVCAEVAQGAVVAPVNFNCPGQVVIAGERAAVERAVRAAQAAGAKRAMLLPVSVPSHCALMQAAGERLAARLNQTEIRAPRIPVLHNATVRTASTPEAIRAALVAQVSAPVRWTYTLQAMAAEGVNRAIECGPGKVLAGLNKRIGVATWSIGDVATLAQALNETAHS